MRRRHYLSTLALSTLPLSGCAGRESPAPSVTPANDPLLFVLTNQQAASATVQVTLTTDDGATVLDETATLAAGAAREYDPGITTPGQYELTVAIEDGLRRTIALNIDPADIRNGSNREVIVRDNGVQVTWEA